MRKEQIFTLADARALLPWFAEASKEAENQIKQVQRKEADLDKAQARVHAIIQHWSETVSKLGAIPKQPFTIDFNSGTDYFCWEYPESDVAFRHDYHTGFAGRHRIKEES